MFQIIEKIKAKSASVSDYPGVTLAFLGDSVTQGCFEMYLKVDGTAEAVYDQEHAYPRYLSRILAELFPGVPFNTINAGISGGSAPHGLERLDRDVLSHAPDLVVVCFGLNDACAGIEKLSDYTQALEEIFDRIQHSGADLIFMTPNLLTGTYVSNRLDPALRSAADSNCERQSSGILDAYMDAARQICEKKNVTVCDCYRRWQQLQSCGADLNNLYSGYMVHPSRNMQWLFAATLAETILGLS